MCAELLDSKIVMVEVMFGLSLVAIGYILGFFTGWTDGRRSRYRERATLPIKEKAQGVALGDSGLFSQDYSHLKYSHLKKKAMTGTLSKAPLTCMPDEKVYDAEIVGDQTQTTKTEDSRAKVLQLK